MVLLDDQLQHIQTIFGSTCGYGNTKVSCLHCSELMGRLVVAWGAEVVIFEPSSVEETSGPDGKGQGAGLSKEVSCFSPHDKGVIERQGFCGLKTLGRGKGRTTVFRPHC